MVSILEICFKDPNRVIRKTTTDKEVEGFHRLIHTDLVKKCIREIRPRAMFKPDKEGTFEVGIDVD